LALDLPAIIILAMNKVICYRHCLPSGLSKESR